MADGKILPVTQRVFDTLLCLVENAGETLAKDRLMAVVWPERVVEENNLARNISTLRRVLGERPGENRFILTVPGRGYRFVAPVRQCMPRRMRRSPLLRAATLGIIFTLGVVLTAAA